MNLNITCICMNKYFSKKLLKLCIHYTINIGNDINVKTFQNVLVREYVITIQFYFILL